EDGVSIRFLDKGKPEAQAHVLRADWKPGDAAWFGTLDEREIAVQVRRIRSGFALAWRGVETPAYVYTTAEATLARLMPKKTSASSGKQVLCPMPCLVISIAVAEGQEVKTGEQLAIV